MDQCSAVIVEHCVKPTAGPTRPTEAMAYQDWRYANCRREALNLLTYREVEDRWELHRLFTATPADVLVKVASRLADGLMQLGLDAPGIFQNCLGAMPMGTVVRVVAEVVPATHREVACNLIARELLDRELVGRGGQ